MGLLYELKEGRGVAGLSSSLVISSVNHPLYINKCNCRIYREFVSSFNCNSINYVRAKKRLSFSRTHISRLVVIRKPLQGEGERRGGIWVRLPALQVNSIHFYWIRN